MKALHLPPHKISDLIILEGIKGIKAIKEVSRVQGHIAGGMGVQSYLPSEAYRASVDLDFSLLWAGGTADFKAITIPLVDHFKSSGYEISFKKKGLTYEYTLIDPKSEDSLLIQHQRRSNNHFEKSKKQALEREVANQRVITKGDLSYAVMSPEDLAVHKISRVIKFAERFGVALPHKTDIVSLRASSDSIRADVVSRLDNATPEEIARLRLFYDCFDIKCLATYAGLNNGYFREVVKEWSDSPKEVFNYLHLLGKLEVSLD